ncbi:hypothetical protein, partial [Methylobacterium nigriterrae]|uniref:hypothetical protein n=1 Tax=Methylobacterium nigriterrae TaxID=3127512 RepID=UPI003013398F
MLRSLTALAAVIILTAAASPDHQPPPQRSSAKISEPYRDPGDTAASADPTRAVATDERNRVAGAQKSQSDAAFKKVRNEASARDRAWDNKMRRTM